MLKIFVCLTAVDNTIFRTIDLKQEKHVVLIDFVTIVTLYKVIDCDLDLGQVILLTTRRHVRWIKSLLTLNFSINSLLFDKLTFEKSVV